MAESLQQSSSVWHDWAQVPAPLLLADPLALPWWSPDGSMVLVQDASGWSLVDVPVHSVSRVITFPQPVTPPGAPPTGGCSPCPSGSQFVAGQCRFAPTAAGTCPPGSAPFPATGLPAYCYTGVLPATVGPANELT